MDEDKLVDRYNNLYLKYRILKGRLDTLKAENKWLRNMLEAILLPAVEHTEISNEGVTPKPGTILLNSKRH